MCRPLSNSRMNVGRNRQHDRRFRHSPKKHRKARQSRSFQTELRNLVAAQERWVPDERSRSLGYRGQTPPGTRSPSGTDGRPRRPSSQRPSSAAVGCSLMSPVRWYSVVLGEQLVALSCRWRSFPPAKKPAITRLPTKRTGFRLSSARASFCCFEAHGDLVPRFENLLPVSRGRLDPLVDLLLAEAPSAERRASSGTRRSASSSARPANRRSAGRGRGT